MSTPGLSIETAASVTASDFVQDHFAKFAHVMRTERAANTSTLGAYINALSGVVALRVVGGHASKDDAIKGVMDKLRECVDRDLRHLAGS